MHEFVVFCCGSDLHLHQLGRVCGCGEKVPKVYNKSCFLNCSTRVYDKFTLTRTIACSTRPLMTIATAIKTARLPRFEAHHAIFRFPSPIHAAMTRNTNATPPHSISRINNTTAPPPQLQKLNSPRKIKN